MFEIHAFMFYCEYSIQSFLEPSARIKVSEKIRIGIPGKQGKLNAIFCNDELTAWSLGVVNEIGTSMDDPGQLWILKELLGRIQNAAGLAVPK